MNSKIFELGETAQRWSMLTVLDDTWFPAPMSGSSHPPITPAHAHTHINSKVCALFSLKNDPKNYLQL